jgi:hypothetical protein
VASGAARVDDSLLRLGQIEWQEEVSAGRGGWRQLERQANEHLEESVAAARAGLAEATEERYRGIRAYLQSEEADALATIGEREAMSGNSNASYHLNAAVREARAALQVLTITSAPENWADTEITLGHAFQDLGEHESNPADFQASVAALEEAEKIQTKERDPGNWAAIQSALGRAFEKWAMLEKGEAAIQHLAQALEHDQASLKPKSPDRDLDEWLTDQENLARTEAELGRLELDPDGKHLKQAAQDYREELKHLDSDRSPEQWRMASDELNQVQALLRIRGEAG